MRVNLSVSLKNLRGETILDNGKEIMLNEYVANMIVNEEAKDNPMQSFELAGKLYNATGEIEIAESEKEIIKRVCTSGRMTILFAAQILTIINNAK